MITPVHKKEYPAIIDLWELSVRATHHFLPEAYLQEIKNLLPDILPQVDIHVYRNRLQEIEGFVGVAAGKIEMLFIHPEYRGKGIGRILTRYCLEVLRCSFVDVNEQNQDAMGFYLAMGFKVTGRQEKDGMGRPFPIIHMEYKNLLAEPPEN